MALEYGQKWAIYMLMAAHPTTANNDGKSQLRADIEAAAGAGATNLHDALVATVNNRFGLAIPAGDIGPLAPGFSAVQLRNALGFTPAEYDPTMGPCPDHTSDVSGASHDHQLAIARAILALTGPA